MLVRFGCISHTVWLMPGDRIRRGQGAAGAKRGQGWTCSKMRARRSGISSWWRRAMTWRPTGSPSDVWPHGIDTAGFQHRLASIVNGVDMAPLPVSTPAMTDGGGPSAGNAGTAVVGTQHDVDVVGTARALELELLASLDGARVLRQRLVLGLLERPARPQREVVGARRPHVRFDLEPQRDRAGRQPRAHRIGELHRLVRRRRDRLRRRVDSLPPRRSRPPPDRRWRSRDRATTAPAALARRVDSMASS